MKRPRKFNKPLGPGFPNPNLITPLGSGEPEPWFVFGVEVTPENTNDLHAALDEGRTAGYRYAALLRMSVADEQRERMRQMIQQCRQGCHV